MKHSALPPAERRSAGQTLVPFPRKGAFATVKSFIRRILSGAARPVAPPSILHNLPVAYHETACCLFSHHAPTPVVDPPVYRYLAALKEAGYVIVFVSTAPALPDVEVDRLRTFCSSILHRDNEGLDFASWKSALDAFPGIKDASELLLANDSVYVHPAGLARVFSTMKTVDCDFWGLTESREKHPHLQSYFLVFRKRALEHSAFSTFWESVGVMPQKKAVIDQYEVGMTTALVRAGLQAAAYAPALCRQNPTLAHPEELLQRFSLPAIKRSILRDNPLRVPLHGWERHFTPDEAGEIRDHMARLGSPLPQAALPEVSILLPTYNGSAFLEQLLDSLPLATGTRLIARDDCSHDATPALLLRYKQHMKERMEVHTGERLGVADNVGWLLGRCGTPYFLLADQDDVWEPDKLPVLWEAMQRLEHTHGKDVPLLVYSDASLIDKDGGLLSPSFFAATGTPPLWGEIFRNTLVFSPTPGCTIMGNLALARAALPVPTDAFMHDWWLLLVAGALGGVRVVNAPLVRYRQHGRNVLGAQVWNSKALFGKALSGLKHSRTLVRKTQLQAKALLERHGGAMSDRHRRECQAWATMPDKRWPQRAITMMHHSLAKPGVLRNVLLYLSN